MKRTLLTILSVALLAGGLQLASSAQQPVIKPVYLKIADLADVATTTATDNYVLTYDSSTGLWGPEVSAGGAGSDVKVGIDAAATAGYLGAAYNDGVFRTEQTELSYVDGGDFITLGIADNPVIPGQGAIQIPVGTTGNRPASVYGQVRANSSLGRVEWYDGAWASFYDDETQIEACIDTLANLTSVQGHTLTLAGNFVTQNNNVTINASGAARTLTLEADSIINSDLSTDADWATSGYVTITKGYFHGAETTATPSAAFTVDWTVKQVQRVTITGTNLDVTFTDPSAPCRLVLVVVQGDGNDTIDWANEASILWPGGTDPTLSTTNAYVDVITFYFDGTNYHGVANYDLR